MEYYNTLLCSENYVKSNTNINDNMAGKYILPTIKVVQDIEVQQVLGTKLYRKLQELVYSGEISTTENAVYKALLDLYIQQFICWRVMADICTITAGKVANLGVMISNDEHTTNATEAERNSIKDQYIHYADHYKDECQKFLLRNRKDYPELDEHTCHEMHSNLYSAASSPIWLGGSRGGKTTYNKRSIDIESEYFHRI